MSAGYIINVAYWRPRFDLYAKALYKKNKGKIFISSSVDNFHKMNSRFLRAELLKADSMIIDFFDYRNVFERIIFNTDNLDIPQEMDYQI